MADKTRLDIQLSYDHFPWFYNRDFMESSDTLWLRVTPKTFRPNISVQTGYNGGVPGSTALYFLLGQSLTMGLNHTWNELDTVSGAIRGIKSTLQKQGSDVASIFKTVTGSDFGARFNQYATGTSAKNDNPIIYEDTNRRDFTIELNFVAHSDAEKEVWNPIQSLMVWSCAESGERGQFDTTFKFPFVFRVQTVTGKNKETGLVNFTDAAITQVLPTYNQPYKNGYPMSAQVQVTFLDINPVYRNRISNDGKSRITAGIVNDQGNNQ